MFIVDAVSFDERGQNRTGRIARDVLLAGTQKAFALPPGLTIFACSPAALSKAAEAKDRGYISILWSSKRMPSKT